MVAANFNASMIPKAREQFARMIMKAFAEAGFGEPQQLAALANAIAESNLDPNARSTPPEQAVGLFQLDRAGGLGAGPNSANSHRLLICRTPVLPVASDSRAVPRLFIMPSRRSRSFSKLASSVPSSERPRGSLMRIGSTKRPLTRIS